MTKLSPNKYANIISEFKLLKDWGIDKDTLDYLIERKNFPVIRLKSASKGGNQQRVFSTIDLVNWVEEQKTADCTQ